MHDFAQPSDLGQEANGRGRGAVAPEGRLGVHGRGGPAPWRRRLPSGGCFRHHLSANPRNTLLGSSARRRTGLEGRRSMQKKIHNAHTHAGNGRGQERLSNLRTAAPPPPTSAYGRLRQCLDRRLAFRQRSLTRLSFRQRSASYPQVRMEPGWVSVVRIPMRG